MPVKSGAPVKSGVPVKRVNNFKHLGSWIMDSEKNVAGSHNGCPGHLGSFVLFYVLQHLGT